MGNITWGPYDSRSAKEARAPVSDVSMNATATTVAGWAQPAVRTEEERATASIAGSRLLDEAYGRELEALDRSTPLVFQCHHGGRSARAAAHYLALGFREVYNLVGGIDAWSTEVDGSVARY